MSFKSFIVAAFSESGSPSISRIISTYLSVASMGLIIWMVKHMMQQPIDKLTIWIGGLPMVIGALAAFTVAPYGVNQAKAAWSSMFKKDSPAAAPVDDPDGGKP